MSYTIIEDNDTYQIRAAIGTPLELAQFIEKLEATKKRWETRQPTSAHAQETSNLENLNRSQPE